MNTRILLDVGSTNSRAWLVRDGQILEARTLAVGVRDSAREGHTKSVRAAVAELIGALTPGDGAYGIAAAGMITSAQGLAEIPHVPAPASAFDLARAAVEYAAPEIGCVPILLVPGVRTAGADDELRADVMRGEETLAVGLVETGLMGPSSFLLNAGSHWKLIALDADGRVLRSRTSLGGEVVHAVQSGTLLAASLPQGPLATVQPEWLEAGAGASEKEGLLRALFAVRLFDQRNNTTPEQRFSWMVGACIGDDVRALVQGGMLARGARVFISGPGAVPEAWGQLLRREGCEAVALTAEAVERAFVTGLWHIASLRAHIRGGEGRRS